MNETCRVCVIDDDAYVRKGLAGGFQLSTAFNFELATATSLEDFMARGFMNQRFDVVIIDLQLSQARSGDEMEGFLLLLSLSELGEADYRIVYTAHPEIENVVRAMRLGATDFVSKVDVPQHEFVEYVEKMLQQRQKRVDERREVNGYVVEHQMEWTQTKPGMFLAIAVDESLSPAQARVVAEGRSRLEALVKYDRLRSENGWKKKLPLDPHLHLVPDSRP